MNKWREVYERRCKQQEFKKYFGGGGQAPPIEAFRFMLYTLNLPSVQPSGAAAGGVYGPNVGPLRQDFPAGCLILGITAAAYQAQQLIAGATFLSYQPAQSSGRRDLFGLSMAYTNDEQITPNGLTMAETLMGSGVDTIFPASDLLVPPAQGILVTCASLAAATLPNLFVTVAFHAMVPRAVG